MMNGTGTRNPQGRKRDDQDLQLRASASGKRRVHEGGPGIDPDMERRGMPVLCVGTHAARIPSVDRRRSLEAGARDAVRKGESYPIVDHEGTVAQSPEATDKNAAAIGASGSPKLPSPTSAHAPLCTRRQ